MKVDKVIKDDINNDIKCCTLLSDRDLKFIAKEKGLIL